MTNRAFGDRLKEAYRNIKNTEIAEKLGVTPSAVQNYVKGRVPDGETLRLIARQTGCDLHWLITGEAKQEKQQFVSFPEPSLEDVFERRVTEIVNAILDKRMVQDLGSVDEFDLDRAMERHPADDVRVIEEWFEHEGRRVPAGFLGVLPKIEGEMTRRRMLKEIKRVLDETIKRKEF